MPNDSNLARFTGTDGFPERVALRAGPLDAVFEPASGFLRHIRVGDREILRGIYAVVRDAHWGTAPAEVRDLKIATTPSTFQLTFRAICRSGEVDFIWRGRVTGDASGTIRCDFDGVAQAPFDRNRIGFCVLHPMALAGHPCRVERVDGTTVEGTFPETISPHQPFKDMGSISHEVVPGLVAVTRFEGDTFEMEDQRNWTDASYKTYCTPLALPFPVHVAQGDRIVQSVTVTLKGDVPARAAAPREPTLALDVGKVAAALPPIGLGDAHHGEPLNEAEQTRLRTLAPAHLRVDLIPSRGDTAGVLTRAARHAEGLGASLEVALFLGGDPERELAELAGLLARLGAPVVRLLVLGLGSKVTPSGLVAKVRDHLASVMPQAAFGAGTDAYFTELNRERPQLEGIDFLGYSLNPQVHAFDSASLVETLEAQPATVANARAIGEGRPVAVTPITLKPRNNPNATGPAPEPPPGRLPPQVDSRQSTLLAAGWTIASVKRLAEAEAGSLTYFETTGWRGVMETAAGTPVPERFASVAGGVYPVFHALADIGEFAGGEVLASRSADPLAVECLALRKAGRARVLAANLSPVPRHVTVSSAMLPEKVRVRVLDSRSVEGAMRAPESWRAEPGLLMETRDGRLDLALAACAVVCIDEAHG